MKRFFGSSRSIKHFAIALISAIVTIGAGLGLTAKVSSDLTTQSVPSPTASAKSRPVFPVQAVQAPIVKPSPTPIASTKAKPTTALATALATPSITPSPTVDRSLPQIPQSQPKQTIQAMYGHLPYGENQPERLQGVGSYVREGFSRNETLDFEAVQAFQQMAIAAKSAGISLMPISGFRTIADQSELFARQINRQGSKEAAAKLSAPPGHSEHHTGYAIDIADRQHPESDLKFTFENTPAYQWLIANAHQYGFELSFPPNNLQGVSFEPWHWRFVGSPRAKQVFSTAKTIQ